MHNAIKWLNGIYRACVFKCVVMKESQQYAGKSWHLKVLVCIIPASSNLFRLFVLFRSHQFQLNVVSAARENQKPILYRSTIYIKRVSGLALMSIQRNMVFSEEIITELASQAHMLPASNLNR